ncbi:MAG: TonB-dependent receptor [Balneolales bacterium]
MLKIIFPTVIWLFIAAQSTAAQNIKGIVRDGESGEPLVSVSLLIVELGEGTTTNKNGEFIFPVLEAKGAYSLRVQHLGYASSGIVITLPDDTAEVLDIRLTRRNLLIREIMLTTSPTGSSISYQPVQSFNAGDLQVRSSNSFGEMLDGSPGVSMRSFGSVTSRPVIRGLDGDRVLVLQNGERMGDLSETAHDHSISMEPLAAYRVEVVRGPASLLYGSSALGGVVNIFTDDVPERWENNVHGNAAFFGNTGNRSGAGYGHIIYGTDHWAMNSRLSYRQAGDLTTPDGRLPGTYLQNLTGSAGVGYKNDRVTGGLALGGLDKAYGLPESVDDPNEEIEIRMNNQALQGKLNRESDGFINNIEFRMNAVRYFHEEVGISSRRTLRQEDVSLDFHQHSFNSTVTLRHKPLAFLGKGAVGFHTQIRSFRVGGHEALTPDANSRSIAGFIYEEAPLSPALTFQFGARFDLRDLDAVENALYPGFNEKKVTGTLSGSLGLHYQPLPHLELGAQVARAHRTPTVEELYANAPHLGVAAYEIGDPSLGNEIGHGFDLFGRFATEWLSLEAATFYNRINDFIVRQPAGEIHAPSGFPVFEFQSADAELWGGEIEVKVRPAKNIIFSGSTDYTHGTYINDLFEPLPFMPPLKHNVALSYDTGSWWVGTQSNLVHGQNRTAKDEPETEGYALLHINGGYRFRPPGNHVISVRLDNATNTRYRDHLSRVENRNYPMPGRTGNITWRWIF